MKLVRSLSLTCALLLAACGGGGGGQGAGPAPAAPTVSLTASTPDVAAGGVVTLSWSAQNADTCAATGSWSGVSTVSGTREVTTTRGASYGLRCTGPGGATTAEAQVRIWDPPSVSLVSSADAVLTGGGVRLQWLSENANRCEASGGWSGPIDPAGSRDVSDLAASTTFTISCSGVAYATPVTRSLTVAVQSTYDLTVTARHERLGPAVESADGSWQPGWAAPTVHATPHVWIELQAPDGAVVAGAYANAQGAVLFTGLSPAVAYTPAIRSRTRNEGGFDLWLVNNTQPVDRSARTVRTRYAPYVDRGQPYVADRNRVAQSATVTARLGWNAASNQWVDADRASGPYAVLSWVNELEAIGREAAGGGAAAPSPAYTVLWSTRNVGDSTGFVDDFDAGLANVGGFSADGYAAIDASGRTTGEFIAEPIMYLAGAQAYGPREITPFTPVHESFHFLQQTRMRSFTPGGSHGFNEQQDPSLAFQEGLASGMVFLLGGNTVDERVIPLGGKLVANRLDWRQLPASYPKGWFQETSIATLLWSLHDPAGAVRLSRAQVLAPLFSTAWQAGRWAPNIWAYGTLLRRAHPGQTQAIEAAGSTWGVTLAGNDEWAGQESVTGGRDSAEVLPVFTTVSPGGTTQVCSSGSPNAYNKLGNVRYLRIIGDGGLHDIRISGPPGSVPYLSWYEPADGSRYYYDQFSGPTLQATIRLPAGDSWARLGDCSVSWSPDPAETGRVCGQASPPPARQCWSITVSP